MRKQAPSVGRIAVAVGFAVSSFGLLVFLWITYGGPLPLKPEGYRITADFPEATTLSVESEVRIGGVSVGRVKQLELSPDTDATRATIEIDSEFAPISSDARAILRLKTLLGETYVELTPGTSAGTRASPPGRASGAPPPTPVALGPAVSLTDGLAAQVEPIPEGGHLRDPRVREAVQIDEVFNALDQGTRRSFQRWQASAAEAIRGRGLDLNDSLGNLGPFLADASRIVDVLEHQDPAVAGLIRDTGTVFEALTERDRELAGMITGSNRAFGALADSDRALAESISILPAFERETRLTLERLDGFRERAHPLVRDLLPVATDLAPTLRGVRRLSPHLKRLFPDLDDLIEVSEEGLPALRRTLGALGPALAALDPALANLNPIVGFLRAYKESVADFMANFPTAAAATLEPIPGQPAPRHVIRAIGYGGPEVLAIHDTRLATNRGNAYPMPLSLTGPLAISSGSLFENFDCRNTDYTQLSHDPDEDEVPSSEVEPGFAPCVIAPGFLDFGFGRGRAPQLFADP